MKSTICYSFTAYHFEEIWSIIGASEKLILVALFKTISHRNLLLHTLPLIQMRAVAKLTLSLFKSLLWIG